MLLKQNNSKVVKSILFTGLLSLLASCGNSSTLESMVRADPRLRENSVRSLDSVNDGSSDSTPASIPANNSNNSQADKKTAEREVASNDSGKQASYPNDAFKTQSQQEETGLPADFPASFPIYPQASLKEAKVGKNKESGMITWTSSDNSKAIADYYQAELTTNNWQIVKPFNFDAKGDIARAIAVKGDRRVHLTLLRSRNSKTNNDGTKLSAIYEPQSQDIASANSQTEVTSKPNSNSNQRSTIATTPNKPKNENNESSPDVVEQKQENLNSDESFPDIVRKKPNGRDLPLKTPGNSDYLPADRADFNDLDSVPEPLIQPLETVAALGILTPYTQEGNVEVSKFAPNAIITRGEYARWLIAANNRYYEGDSGKKIYVVNDTKEPAFQDIKNDNPDFGAIQGLAEAGLVPSRLTQDSTKLMFRPDAPLTREELITWKVPLDTRQALPKASIEAIEESWGFQDAANIDSSAVRALYADYQNGDRSNVRRIFGFTTLFQPKKPVTRAEAAASLWYFGFQGDGITAQEILELETETESNS